MTDPHPLSEHLAGDFTEQDDAIRDLDKTITNLETEMRITK